MVCLETELKAEELLLKLLLIELNLGRKRDIVWGPRTLDLDLIWFDNQKIDSEKLTLPHPRAHERCFVLKPWFEIDSLAKIGDKYIKEIMSDLDCTGVKIFPSKLVNS